VSYLCISRPFRALFLVILLRGQVEGVEARHNSWFDEEAYSFFRENDICIAWSQLAEMQTPPIVTTDFIYLRFIGDRSIDEKDFGTIQKDSIKELEYWASVVKKLKRTRF
jgi:uncharacterized protein YecE (DUF72 family)